MIDVAVLRHQPEVIVASLKRRGIDIDVGALAALDEERRVVRARAEELRAAQKALGKSVPTLEGDARQEAIEQAGRLSSDYKAALAEADELDARFEALWITLPNLTDPTAAPASPRRTRSRSSAGANPTATFEEQQDHVDLASSEGVDRHRAGRQGLRLALRLPDGPAGAARVRSGSVRVRPTRAARVHAGGPARVGQRATRCSARGSSRATVSRSMRCPSDDLYLVGTSEVPLAAFHADEILDAAALPLRYVGVLDVLPA